MFNSKKRVKDMGTPGSSNAPTPSAGNAEKLEIAKRLALRINAQKNLGAEAQVFVPFHFKVSCLQNFFFFFFKMFVQCSVFCFLTAVLFSVSSL